MLSSSGPVFSILVLLFIYFWYYSVTKSYLTLCNPMDCSTSGFPVLHHFPELAPLMSIDSMMPSNHPVLCCPLLLLPFIFPSIRVFPISQLFTSGGQSIRASALSTVLPINIQDWFPLGLTGLISLLTTGLSRVLSNTTVQKHQFFGTQPSLRSNSHIHAWLPEKP